MLIDFDVFIQPKCEQYWSDTVGKERKFGEISIKLQMIDTWADYTMRSIKVSKVGII